MSFKKNLVKTLIVSSLFLSIGTSTVFANTVAGFKGENVNIRKEASINAEVLTKTILNQELNVLALSGDWLKVEFNGAANAFVSKEFVVIKKADATVLAENVNIRKEPNSESEILGSANMGSILEVTGLQGDFYQFTFNGNKAYIHKEFLKGEYVDLLNSTEPAPQKETKKEEFAIVESNDGLNVRKNANIDSEVLTKLSYNEGVKVLEVGQEWHKVDLNGSQGYVSAEFTAIKNENTGNGESSKANLIIEYGKKFLGTPYVWGGTNLSKGVDCSGFVYEVMKDNGITLNRSSRDQINNGKRIDKSELKKGDLVFFDTTGSNDGNISHVGIFMGGSEFIHASSSTKSYCVTISSLNEDYYIRNYVGATRVIN